MVILGLGAVSLLTAAEGYTGRISDVASRVAARWVAENALAEARLGIVIADRDIAMLGQSFDVDVARADTDDPELVALTFNVSTSEAGQVLFVLDGFVPAVNLR